MANTLPRVIVTDHAGAYVCDLTESEVITLTTIAELNGEHSLTLTTTRQLSKGDRIIYRDKANVWAEYVVESIESVHETASVVMHTYWCPWSLMHDLSGTYVSSMPGTGGTPATATQALTAALAGTARWTVGTVDVTTTGSASFYRMSGWEALQELIKVWGGEHALVEAAVISEADTVVTAVSGAVGLKPTLEAIRKEKRIALANKETLVCAGEIVMREAKECGAEIVPVDSEHSAIFQCLTGRKGELRKILLTGSGGPFRGWTREQTKDVTPEQAVRHPNWSMGAKISVDSATMMNKGLEFIEAMHLFSVTPDDIEVLIHPESVVHSMVELVDGTVIAQLGVPDMGLPIQYALTCPALRWQFSAPVPAAPPRAS